MQTTGVAVFAYDQPLSEVSRTAAISDEFFFNEERGFMFFFSLVRR